MAAPRAEWVGVGVSICRLNTDEFPIFIIAKIRHGMCIFFPGVPNDGAVAARLFDDDGAVPLCIVEGDCFRGVVVNAVNLLADAYLARLDFFCVC